MEPPLPFGNAASRWYYVLLRELVRRGHLVKTFAACSKPEEIEKTRKLFPEDQYEITMDTFPQRIGVASKFNTVFFPNSFHFSGKLKSAIQKELDQGYDVLHIEQLWASWVGVKLDRTERALINVHHLLSVDLEFNTPQGLKNQIAQRQTFHTEKRLVRQYGFIRSCSPRLVSYMQNWNPRAYIETVPVGIDASLYDFIPDERRSTTKTLSLIGNMGWYPGQSAAFRLLKNLWPEIRRQVPEAKLQIVGWSARSVLKDHLDDPGVEIHENVPEIQPYFENTSVMLYAPARGSGMKIKILEAMAFGIPVVTTREGKEGLPSIDGQHMGISEDDQGLIQRAVELLNSTEKQNTYRHEARRLLEEHCGPQNTVDSIERLYQKIMQKTSSQSSETENGT